MQISESFFQKGDPVFAYGIIDVEKVSAEENDIRLEGIDRIKDVFDILVREKGIQRQIGKKGDQKSVAVIVNLFRNKFLFADPELSGVDVYRVIKT